jgi:hypothetical protein
MFFFWQVATDFSDQTGKKKKKTYKQLNDVHSPNDGTRLASNVKYSRRIVNLHTAGG